MWEDEDVIRISPYFLGDQKQAEKSRANQTLLTRAANLNQANHSMHGVYVLEINKPVGKKSLRLL